MGQNGQRGYTKRFIPNVLFIAYSKPLAVCVSITRKG